MEEQQIIDFERFCGRDTEENVKAICMLQVASTDLETNEIVEIESVTISNSEIAMDIGHDVVTIDVKFQNYLDFEYLQAGDLCVRFKEKHSKGEFDENVTLLLTITQNGAYSDFLIGQEAMWAFTSEKPEDKNHMIRFWFLKHNFAVYQISDRELKSLMERIEEEGYLEKLESGEI